MQDRTEFGLFVVLLAVAGNETTRNAMTHGMNAFFDHPGQWELFVRDRQATTADEIIRWATPVHCFHRTATGDTEVGGVRVVAGQRAGLFYSSANYDEAVFDSRGANLARMEMKLIFNEIADQMPDIAKVSEPRHDHTKL